MPTYAYQCPKCGHEFHKFHKMTVKTRPKCPVCGTTAERRITGGAGLHFKGSGFYSTDYKKAGTAGDAGEAGKTDKAGEKGKSADTGKGEKKPESKPKKGTDA
jgi:putative FmdB family regulatory protein